MTIDHGSVGEQILNGVFIAFWILSRPFVWIWHFIISVLIETKSTAIKIISWVVATGIVGLILQHFFQYTLK
ncbi:MAG TPA: hypothetical protein VGO63_02955 [Candidatus Paceibacterota bacterium]|jgi:hypothetical protein|nr:hypothetical protein [Candidatus Paceibacterota bacterium]